MRDLLTSPTSAETARAALDGFTQRTDQFIDHDGPQPDYRAEAWQLASVLGRLLAELGSATS
jgi:hypothetical protein